MKARSRVKVGNQKNNPGYRTPSTFIGQQNYNTIKYKKINNIKEKQHGFSKS